MKYLISFLLFLSCSSVEQPTDYHITIPPKYAYTEVRHGNMLVYALTPGLRLGCSCKLCKLYGIAPY